MTDNGGLTVMTAAVAASALSFINRNIQDPPIKHARTAAVYEKVNLLRDHTEV